MMNKKVLTYGMHLQGISHKKEELPCQDFHQYKELNNGWVIAAIADGVGSAKHSEFGSKLAVETTIEYLAANLESETDINNVIEKLAIAYQQSYETIVKFSEQNQHDVRDYDTTLSVAVYDGTKVAYGHVGDGGIIGLGTNGQYEFIARPMKGPDGITVIPLRFGIESWNFGVYDEVTSIILVTDGLLDGLFAPKIFKLIEKELYVIELRKFLDKNFNGITIDNIEEFEKVVESIFGEGGVYYDITEDDKTIVVLTSLVNTSQIMENEYYSEPDWTAIRKAKDEIIYAKHKMCMKETSDE